MNSTVVPGVYHYSQTIKLITTPLETVLVMKILISGASGFLGSALVDDLSGRSHRVVRLVRSEPTSEDEARWKPYEGELQAGAFDGVDTLIHLSGENIFSIRWTEKKKKAIRDSRIKTTRFLCERLCEMEHPPKTWLCASAIGFYGDRGDERCDEDSEPGGGFFGTLCRDWEAETVPAQERGIRVVNLRFGLVMSSEGGMLPMLLKQFKFGLGGVVGSGDQFMSWVAIQDVLGAVNHVLVCENVEGPVNIVSPNPVTNREFTKTLGRIVSRPTIMHAPAFAMRLVSGEFADEALLASTRVYPKRLLDSGYTFAMPELEGALRAATAR